MDIANGQINGNLQDARQIAVSTTNLTPDATTGLAPLEKETAFTMEQTQAAQPVLTEQPMNVNAEPVQTTPTPTEQPWRESTASS